MKKERNEKDEEKEERKLYIKKCERKTRKLKDNII